jgi:hypothetical protein
MFKKNTDHLQTTFFGFENQLNEAQKKELNESEYSSFYELVFCNINEDLFSPLYSDRGSRPNAPINAMVSALILYNRKNWTYNELFENINFNLLTRKALGLSELGESPFCQATLFNFQHLINEYWLETGENILEQVFDGLTTEQLKKLKIKTNIQRTDSFLIGSNIRNYSRLQLIIETLRRLHRIIEKKDRNSLETWFAPYLKETSGQYVYRIKGSNLEKELEKIAETYNIIYQTLKQSYNDMAVFKIFERVYTEHFTIVENKITVKPPEQLHSSCLQSPDDPDATYRKKKKQTSKGQSVNATETCNPENPLNLITDIAVETNNTDDSKILNSRLDNLKEKTPELDEMYTDGGYGSADNDKKMQKLGIKHIQTAIKGREAKVEIMIEQKSEMAYEVSCPNQSIESQKTQKRNKACFDLKKCSQCPLGEFCPTVEMSGVRKYYFTDDDYLKKKRQKTIDTIPIEKKYLRNNIEATVKEFKQDYRHGKLKVRGRFKTEVFAFAMGISINFGRIYRHISESSDVFKNFLSLFLFKFKKFMKNQKTNCVFFYFTIFNDIRLLKNCSF